MDRSRPDAPAEGISPPHESGAVEAQFHALIEANADGVLVVRRDGILAFANPAACELLGRGAESLIGHPFGVPIVPGETTEVDVTLCAARVRVAELRVAQITWEETPAYLVTLRDVTERRHLEERLRRQAEQLAEADRRKNEFLTMLAHELRNPLAPLRNAAHLLRHDGEDESTRVRMAALVARQVDHLARLLDDLLDVSRISRGKIVLRSETLDLDVVVAHAVEGVHHLVAEKRQELAVAVTPGLRLEADRTRLEQVLVNLLTNAVKYTDAGGRIALHAQREGEQIVITVRDNGTGITQEMLSQIFEPFAQAEQTLDRSQGGLGIGLSLVRGLVELHGGSVNAASDGPGRGSLFTVRLPAPLSKLPPDPPPAVAPPSPVATLARRSRVLVVDDNVPSAETLAQLLRFWGHDVRIAHDGPSALEAAAAYVPEVVLLDIGLPGMDGYRVATRLREMGLVDAILIAATGYAQEEARDRARAASFHHHLPKPIDLNALELILTRPVSSISAPGTKR